ncbi:MAG TPA: ATP-binding protein [Chloroflexota bacterium]|nr:ATP-binding protein [Chloroflexota bacterium]
MFTRIQWRIAAAYVALIALAMFALGIYLTQTLRAQQLCALEDHLARQAILVADDATYRLGESAASGQTPDLDPLAKSLGKEIGARVTLIARDGTVLGDSDHDPRTMENHGTRPEVVQALRLGRGESERHSATLDRDLLYVAVPMRQNEQIVGVARVALPVDDVDASLNHLAVVVGVATSATAMLAILLAVLIARATTEPLGRLTTMAQGLAAGDLGQKLAVGTRDEVGQLASAFNRMATDLRHKIETIEAQRSETAAILAGMADGVVIVDAEQRVLSLNRAAERLLEITEVAARGKTAAEVVRQHELVARLSRADVSNSPVVVEVGRDRRQVQVVVTPVRLGGATRSVILLQDVTDLRRAEAMRRDFVANVSHELRTPLASLRALAETLEDGALEDPPAAREFLGRMQVEVDGLSQMVEELLELARIESGQVQLRVAAENVGVAVQAAAERLRPQAERQGVVLQISLPPEAVEAAIDAERMHQVVVNLVHNAVKFTPPGGSVEVRVERRGDDVAVVVADTGVGVAAADLPRLFERFYKADRSRASSGTGLGLAIVKHLAQAHGGRVWAASPGAGKGTTFTVLLPRRGPPLAASGRHVPV